MTLSHTHHAGAGQEAGGTGAATYAAGAAPPAASDGTEPSSSRASRSVLWALMLGTILEWCGAAVT